MKIRFARGWRDEVDSIGLGIVWRMTVAIHTTAAGFSDNATGRNLTRVWKQPFRRLMFRLMIHLVFMSLLQ